MRRGRAAAAGVLASAAPALALALAGCSGEPAVAGLGEPLRVTTAVFKSGPLPGAAPTASDAGAPAAAGPSVTAVQLGSGVAFAGQPGKRISGRTSKDAVAIAVRFPDTGSGYWVQALGVPDPTAAGELTFDMIVDFADTAPLGNQVLRFVAIAAGGQAGAQGEIPLCVAGVVPDNLNACDATLAPPAAVISLAWDSAADLDLQLVTPAGALVDPKHPSTASADAGAPATGDPGATGPGIFDGDGQAGCRAGGIRRENLVWQAPPAPGTYLVRVNLFDACGAAAARFTVTLHTVEPTGAGTSALVERQRIQGALLPQQANGGAGPGLYVGAFDL